MTEVIKHLYTIEESMHTLGLKRTSVYQAIKDGRLRVRKFGTKSLIEHSEIQNFINSLPINQ